MWIFAQAGRRSRQGQGGDGKLNKANICRLFLQESALRQICLGYIMANSRKGRGFLQMKTLREAKIGETVTVVKVHGEGALRRRVMDMGITKGTALRIRKVAPLGDPIELTVRGYELSLRKADIDLIEVA